MFFKRKLFDWRLKLHLGVLSKLIFLYEIRLYILYPGTDFCADERNLKNVYLLVLIKFCKYTICKSFYFLLDRIQECD